MNRAKPDWTPAFLFRISLVVFVALAVIAEVLREGFDWVRLVLSIALTPLLAGVVWFISWLAQKGRSEPPSRPPRSR